RSLPVMVTRPPGATGLVRSAEFTRPVRRGVGTAASKEVGMTVIPDRESETIVFWLARTASVRLNTEEPRTRTGATVGVPGAGVTAAGTGVNRGDSTTREVGSLTWRLSRSMR